MPNIGPLELLILFIPLWVLPAYLIAKYAERKGQSFALFLLIGLIAGWFISGIAALLVGNGPQSRSSHLDQLERLTELRNAGALSQEEFDLEKDRILRDRS